MIVYLDSSVLARVYLRDEAGQAEAVALLGNPELGLVTGTWSRIEVSGALVCAGRGGRGDVRGLLALLDSDLGADGPVAVVRAGPGKVETQSLELVRKLKIRTMDAWHLATVRLALPGLAEPGEQTAFCTRDLAQAAAAELLGLNVM